MTGKTNRLADFTGGDVSERSRDHPLADECSLCGEEDYPNSRIDISDEPMERQHGDEKGRMEYRWAHVECITGEDVCQHDGCSALAGWRGDSELCDVHAAGGGDD